MSFGTRAARTGSTLVAAGVEILGLTKAKVAPQGKDELPRNLAAEDKNGQAPRYARNVELRTGRLARDPIVFLLLFWRERTGFVDSIDDFLQSQGFHCAFSGWK